MVQISLLGPIQFLANGRPIRGFRSIKAQALWAYLCLAEHPVPRTTLVDLFWPDMDETRGRRNLSWALSQLTKKLPGTLQADRHQIQFVHHPDYQVDVHHYRTFADEGTAAGLQRAVELYHAELMQGVFLDDCPEFESWLIGERELWRQQAVNTMTQLMQMQTQQGLFEAGIDTGRRLLRVDPWNESVHQALMRLLTYTGQKEAAVAQYKRCAAVLEEELGIAPSPQTKTLYRDILTGALEIPPISDPEKKVGIPSNIPAALGVSIGRHREITELVGRLQQPDCRLLTLTGLGGVGKTHVALQVMRQMAIAHGDLFPHGIYYVNLSRVTKANQIALEIGRALQIPFSDTIIDLDIQLLMALQGKKRLLLLDNFEQLIGQGNLVYQLLRGCPDLKLLITSRIPLHLPEEWVVQLDGLSLSTRSVSLPTLADPAIADESAVDDHAASARRLFLHRVGQQRDFQPGTDDLAAIDDICRLVDGLPLGIELAAALVRLVSPVDLYEALSADFDTFLTEPLRPDERSRSLHTVVAFSWSRLTADEQEALLALSIFEGGFTREVAIAVAGTTLQTLAKLKDYALIRLSEVPGRFTLHNIVQAYVRQQEASGQTSLAVYARAHAFYFGDWLGQRTPELHGPRQRHALALIERDWENIRLAWQWAADHSDAAVSFFSKAYGTVFHFCDMRSRFREGLVLFLAAVQAIEGDQEADPSFAIVVGSQLRARAGWFSFLLGAQNDGRTQLIESLTALEAQKDEAETLFARSYLAAVMRYFHQLDEAADLIKESLAWLEGPGRELPDRDHYLAITHNIISQIALDQEDFAQAELHGRLSLRYVREIENPWSMGFTLVNLGNVALAQQDYALARRWFTESLEIRRETGDLRGTALCLSLIGECAEGQEDLEEAADYFRRSHSLFDEIDNQWGLALTLKNLGGIAFKRGDLLEARRSYWRSMRKALRMEAHGLLWETLHDLQTFPFDGSLDEQKLKMRLGQLLENEQTLPQNGPDIAGRPEAAPLVEMVQLVHDLLHLFEL